MKIEVAESLIYSYLKHVEGCRIVQTNWKTSGKWEITEYDTRQARILFEEISNSEKFSGIFKNNSFEQLIKQAEIDVLGLNTAENSIFGIDVAFHEAGLNYGDAVETSERVLKKIFRTIFIMQSYFKEFDKFNSYFVTPKVNPSHENPIRELIQEANEIINDESISIKFLANDDFFNEIVSPLLIEVEDENDTTELFCRSFKLLKLDNRKQSNDPLSTNETLTTNKIRKTTKVNTTKTTENGMKIGQFVQFSISKAFENNLISKEEIRNLQDKEYSKKVFNQNFEVLKSSEKETTDERGRNRYYANNKFCGDYYLTSQWFEYHWTPFKNWLEKLENKN
ncbi:MAG: hypothetical protein ACOX7E_00010 [Paludibacter sp.]|jgi:hypothetical protein